MNTLERIARILERARVAGGWLDDDVARNVLLAIRDPAPAMTAAGGDARDDLADRWDGADIIWRAMIDAALNEKPESNLGHG